MRVMLSLPVSTPSSLAEALAATVTPIGHPEAALSGMATHAGEVQAGDVFLALRGKRQNGADFIGEALRNGAAAVVAERDLTPPAGNYWLFRVEDVEAALLRAAAWRRARSAARVVAVTGSSGKTTVKELLATLLSVRYRVEKSTGNHNSLVGLSLTLLSMGEPDVLVQEIGISHPHEMAPLSRALSPHIALVTGIGSAHLGNFPDMSALLREKLAVAEGLYRGGTLLLPEALPYLPLRDAPYRVWRFGTSKGAEASASDIVYGRRGTSATVTADGVRVEGLCWQIAGGVGLSCLLLGAAVGRLFGMTPAEIRQGMCDAGKATPRMRRLPLGGRLLIDDAYNASPEAMLASLEALSYMAERRPRVAVLGDMLELGERARDLHEGVGALAADCGLSALYLIGAHAADYARGAHRGGMPTDATKIFGSGEHDALAAALQRELPRDAAVLFKASRAVALERVIEKMEVLS